MAKSRTKRDRLSGPGDISEQLWHYDGTNAYKEYDERSARKGFFSRGRGFSKSGNELDKLTQFMSAGGMRHETRVADDDIPALRKMKVIRALAVFTILWVIFFFVAQ